MIAASSSPMRGAVAVAPMHWPSTRTGALWRCS